MGIELVGSAALDAVALFDVARYADEPGPLPEELWHTLRSVRDEPEVRAIPDENTSAAAIAALLARLLGPGRLSTLALPEIAGILGRARPIARLSFRSGGRRFVDAAAEAAREVLEHDAGFARLIGALIEGGFQEWWTALAQPRIAALLSALRRDFGAHDVDHVLFLVQKLKARTVPPTVWVYLSHCVQSGKVCLSESELLVSADSAGNGRYLVRSVAYELLRGFATQPLLALYQQAMANDPYLRGLLIENQWRPLIGPEEMFLEAADLYVSYKAGLYSLEEAFAFLDGLYGNNMPFSVIVLDLLLRSDGLPGSYDEWLLDRFRNGTIRVGRIADQVDEILPGYSESGRRTTGVHEEYLARIKDLGLC